MTTDRPWLQDEAVRARLEPVRSLIHWAYEHGYHEMGYPPEDALAEAAYRARDAEVEAARTEGYRTGVEAALAEIAEHATVMAQGNATLAIRYLELRDWLQAALLPPSPPRSEEASRKRKGPQ